MAVCNARSTEFRVGTKPLTNLVCFQNKLFPSNVNYTDFVGKVVSLEKENRNSYFYSFLEQASLLDSYEYFIFVENSQKLSPHVYNNLSTWKPLLRYQVDLAVLKICNGPMPESKSSEYSTTSYIEETTTGPFLISSRYLKKFIKKVHDRNSIIQTLNQFLKFCNTVCFWPKVNLATDNIKLEHQFLEFPILFPDGVPNKSFNNDYIDLASLIVNNNIIYIGSSAADLLILAQAGCKVISYKPKNKIDFIDNKIWLQRFGLEDRVTFVDDNFIPDNENYAVVYSTHQDIENSIKTRYLAYFPFSVFLNRSISLQEAQVMNIPLQNYTSNIKVKV